jgi:hypothetical protein
MHVYFVIKEAITNLTFGRLTVPKFTMNSSGTVYIS